MALQVLGERGRDHVALVHLPGDGEDLQALVQAGLEVDRLPGELAAITEKATAAKIVSIDASTIKVRLRGDGDYDVARCM